ncbi:hypothetical protein FG379_000816 [Cryptosporidium bovis]|uniref:uncharacterized protein n=1 Tax=Cryptosporidium bovis TaxID=310047 RepID=UPI00351A2B0B|nr:hypothetical protein FG379_000816 [Cryptosporidium bovis]
MELLANNKNNEEKKKVLKNYPDLRCSVYLAYPEFDEYAEEESDVQLIFCIRELYDYVYNKKEYVELSKKLNLSNDMEIISKDIELKKNINNDVDISKCSEHSKSEIKIANRSENNEYNCEIGSCVQEFLDFVSNISSIISVCLETKLDRNQPASVYNKQIKRLREQERNIERIRYYAIDNEVLLNLVEKVSNSIQYKLYCLVKICSDNSICINDDKIIDNGFQLTPLRIKYPYLTGTYIQVGEKDINGNVKGEDLLLDKNRSWYKDHLETREYKNSEKCKYLNNTNGNEITNKMINEIELNARNKLKGNKNKTKLRIKEESDMYNSYYLNNRNENICDKEFEDDYASLYNKYDKNSNENCEVTMDKLVGGATRIINKKMEKDIMEMKVDGWGLIRHNLDKKHIEDINKSVKNYVHDSLGNAEEKKDIVVIDRRKNKKIGTSNKALSFSKNNSNSEKPKNSKIGCSNGNNEKPDSTCNSESFSYNTCSDDYTDNSNNKSVRKMKSIFEKSSPTKRVLVYNNEINNDGFLISDNKKKVNTNYRKNKDSYSRSNKKVSSIVGSPSHVHSQNISGITTGTSTRQQLSNYKETMYSTSSWLPLSRNTGFNLEYLNSNVKANEKQSGSEYNPAAEYARFSDAVGKAIHPIVADESYRNNGKNILNPKKLFNAKFGTLTVDNFKEIQEKLRLKTEGWTIHGSGLQDPRANLFWDPAVMTAASTASLFYTNMQSSNSPLLINTLIPSNSQITRRMSSNQEFILDSPSISSSHSSFSDELEINHQNCRTDSQSDEKLEYYKEKSREESVSVTNGSNYTQNPISSMRNLSKRRNK